MRYQCQLRIPAEGDQGIRYKLTTESGPWQPLNPGQVVHFLLLTGMSGRLLKKYALHFDSGGFDASGQQIYTTNITQIQPGQKVTETVHVGGVGTELSNIIWLPLVVH